MRMPQLKRLVLLAIAAAVLLSIPRLLRLSSSQEWGPNVALGFREANARVQPNSKLPFAPVDEKSAEQPAKKEKEVSPLEHEKKILLRDDIDLMQRMQEINSFRQERLAKECTKLKLKGIVPSNEDIRNVKVKPEILVSDEHKAIFCSTGSEYSEAWRGLLGGDSLRSLFSYRQESISYRLRYYFKILLVEQPLVRFLSAYKKALAPNSLSDSDGRNTGGKLQELSEKIRREFGMQDVTSKGNITDLNARLADFAKFVIREIKNSGPLHQLWERIHMLCQPCSVHYDYISRDRTVKQDSKYIFSKLEKMPLKQYDVNRTESTDAESLEEIRRELKKTLLNEVYNAYEIDHELFGYTKPWD